MPSILLTASDSLFSLKYMSRMSRSLRLLMLDITITSAVADAPINAAYTSGIALTCNYV